MVRRNRRYTPATPEGLRHQGVCMVITGSVLLTAGICGLVATAILAPFAIGSTIFALVLGPIFIGTGSRNLYLAKQMQNNPDARAGHRTTATVGTTQINYISTGQSSFPEATGQTTYNFGATTFGNQAPPYSNYGMFSTAAPSAPPPPPSYQAATGEMY